MFGSDGNNGVPDVDAIMQSINLFVYVMNNPIRWIDPLGLRAGEPFRTLDAAAADFARRHNADSIIRNVELGTFFYTIEVNGVTMYTYWEPWDGDRYEVGFSWVLNSDLMETLNIVAFGHTHGAWEDDTSRFANDNFGAPDIAFAQINNTILFVATPSGHLRRFDPNAPWARRNVRIQTFGIPHDPHSPVIRNCRSHRELIRVRGSCPDCVIRGDISGGSNAAITAR